MRRVSRRRFQRLVAVAGLVTAPAVAESHAFGARYDLPLPLGFYMGAAGLAVAASFLGSFFFVRTTSTRPLRLHVGVPIRLAIMTAGVLRALGILLLLSIIATALVGPEMPTRNFGTVTVWVLWWVGLLLFCALVGDIWRFIDPFRGSILWTRRVLGGKPSLRVIPLPGAAGWLAVAGLVSIAWLELVSDWSEEPRALGVIILVYMGLSFLAAMIFGASAWFSTADPIARLFDLMGRMAPLAVASGTRLRLQPPAEGLLDTTEQPAGTAAFVVSLIAIVLFDGLAETPFWAAILEFIGESRALRGLLLFMQAEGVDLLKLVKTVGLLTTILLANLAYLILSWLVSLASGGKLSTAGTAAAFAPSLLPIAIAYHLSHYVSYLAFAGQLIIPAISDPFGLGWNLFGTREHTIDLGVIDAERVWWIAVVALVAGHGLSVLVAHRQAIKLLGSPTIAVRSQFPMMVFMVGLTMLSLWILAQPIVE